MILNGNTAQQRQGFISQQGASATSHRALQPSPHYLREQLALRLPQSRLQHVYGVEGLAVWLSLKWGVDPEKVLMAALLHDFCKGMGKDALLEVLAGDGPYALTPEDKQHPELWHGLAAARYAAQEFAIGDDELLSAIAYHTTGIPHWNPVGLVLYVADTLEPTRRFAGVETARRELLSLPLEQAARGAATIKLNHLESRNATAHSNTTAMVAWLDSRLRTP